MKVEKTKMVSKHTRKRTLFLDFPGFSTRSKTASLEDLGTHGFKVKDSRDKVSLVKDREQATAALRQAVKEASPGAVRIRIVDFSAEDTPNRIVVLTENEQKGNCLSQGIMTMARADGQAFTQEDLNSAKARVPHGQISTLSGVVGDLTVTGRWFCDSSG